MTVNTPYITPPRDESMVERWRQRVSELLNQISDGLDVNIQDQTTPMFSLYFNQVEGATTLSANATINTSTITVTSTTGIVNGSYIGVFNSTENRYYLAFVVGTPVGNVVTLDTPLNFDYKSGDTVAVTTAEMAVDGSTISQNFEIAGPSSSFDIDVTRIIFTMQLTSAPDDGLFGNITKLVNGVVIRKVDGTTYNYANFKDNSDLANLCYDLTYSTRSGGGGTWGLRARWTFASQGKMGVVVRLSAGESLEAVVQDDLTVGSDIVSFKIIAQGHIVDP